MNDRPAWRPGLAITAATLALLIPLAAFAQTQAEERARDDGDRTLLPAEAASRRAGTSGEAQDTAADEAGSTVLEEVQVRDNRIYDPVRESPARSMNRVTREDIRRNAPKDLYEALQGQPGVTIEGGPRTQGKRIVIRGFSDNEDVLVRVDGATQNFEKYRYGNGVDIDPNLVRQVDVLRGASTLTEGSGAVGGVVKIETIDAADLLQGDERWGVDLRLAYGANDRSQQRVGNFYARPLDWLDVLVSQVTRRGDDFRLPGGETLENSSENATSELYKVEVAGNKGFANLMHRQGTFEGLQPLDATGGGPGVFGNVRRETAEDSNTLEFEWSPLGWLNLQGNVGHTAKEVIDRASQLAGGGDDFFDYDILSANLRNRSEWSLGPVAGTLNFGLQATREVRDTLRISPTFTGTNLSQPPGSKFSWGGFVEQVFDLHDLRITAAMRTDQYRVQALAESADLLRAQGSPEAITFVRLSPGAGVEYVPGGGNLTLFYDYFEAFRPPLIDEYFTAGAFSRCQRFTRFLPRPQFCFDGRCSNSIRPPLSFAQFLAAGRNPATFGTYINGYLAALAAFQTANEAWPQNPLSQANGTCGADYVPEEARNHEIGASWLGDGLLRTDDHLFAKLTFYRVDVRNTLESIYENAVTGRISQPGIERREGLEFELNYETAGWRLGVTGATVSGFFDLGEEYFTENIDPDALALTTPADRGRQPLFDVPGDTLQVSLTKSLGSTFEAGYRVRATGERVIVTGLREDCPFTLPFCNIYGRQAGFVLHSVNATWNPDRHTSVQITVDNLTDVTYQLPGFAGGLGAIAPGRSAVFTLGVRF
jgi:hemoglobin/transferrin/lactoferrin receptor protein